MLCSAAMEFDPEYGCVYPLAYFITFTCFGTHLHGTDRGSVDPKHNVYGAEILPAMPYLEQFEQEQLDSPPYSLCPENRRVVLKGIREVCEYRGYALAAAHVRTTHVHTVVAASSAPEPILDAFKSYASRALNKRHPAEKGCTRWTRHGSTRYLWTLEEVEERIHTCYSNRASRWRCMRMPNGWRGCERGERVVELRRAAMANKQCDGSAGTRSLTVAPLLGSAGVTEARKGERVRGQRRFGRTRRVPPANNTIALPTSIAQQRRDRQGARPGIEDFRLSIED